MGSALNVQVCKAGHHYKTKYIRTMPAKRLHTFVHRFMISLTMNKMIFVFSFFYLFGPLLSVTVEPYHRHVIVSPHSASEVFNTVGERQILAPAPVSEPEVPLAAPAAPVAAVAPAPHLAFAAAPALGLASTSHLPIGASLGLSPSVAVAPGAPLPVAPVAKVAQFKLSYPQYAYGYSVQDFTTGDNKVAKEVREGEIVKGSYSLADPDGTKRTVNYYADPVHGFNAIVHKTQILK